MMNSYKTLVAITCLTGCWSTCLNESHGQHADLVIHHANVIRCDREMHQAQAVAIKDGRVLAVGTDREIQPFVEATTTVIVDARGQCVTPGLADSHLHFVGLGQSLQMLDLRDAESWEAIVTQVELASKQLPKGAWIEGRGWHQSKWKSAPLHNVDGYPDHRTLSEVVPDHPVLLTHASGHALFANELAMKLARIGPETSDPPGGEILKDASGRPIGVFRENASSLIRRAQMRAEERMTEDERLQQLRERVNLAGQVCLENGITSVHDAGSSFADAQLLRRIADAQELPVRMTVMIRADSRTLENRLAKSKQLAVADGFLCVRSVKVSIDGALGPHGAWLLEPYSDLPSSSGLNTVDIDELVRIATLCKRHGWQLCVHAIGDRANREVLDVFEKVLGDDIALDHRWRIEHAQHLSPSDIPRFAKLGIIPAMQANHCTSDAIFVPTRLGERRSAQGAYVWRSLIDSGSIIPNGTDAPVERVDPRVSLYAAVTRKLTDGSHFYPEQCMTRREALLSYTLWPAIASFSEQDLGSIDIGKRADLVMWDRDLVNCEPQELLQAAATRVWIGGVEKFRQNK